VGLQRININAAVALRDEVNQLLSGGHSDTLDLSESGNIALEILQPLLSNILESSTGSLQAGEYLYLCCLAAQSLCLGLVAFCQGHTGPIELFFINRPQKLSVPRGSSFIETDERDVGPHITAGLAKLTCLGKMTEGPLITFKIS
jgi:hypothetical protein